MNSRTLIAIVALGMLTLIAAAFALDCVRLAEQARGRVALADEELIKHEQRLVKLLNDSSESSPEVQTAIDTYQAANNASARHSAFDQLLTAYRKTMQSEVDPTNPLDRKFMDDVAGAINRREIAEGPYDAENTAYENYLSGTRGKVARWFSPKN